MSYTQKHTNLYKWGYLILQLILVKAKEREVYAETEPGPLWLQILSFNYSSWVPVRSILADFLICAFLTCYTDFASFCCYLANMTLLALNFFLVSNVDFLIYSSILGASHWLFVENVIFVLKGSLISPQTMLLILFSTTATFRNFTQNLHSQFSLTQQNNFTW